MFNFYLALPHIVPGRNWKFRVWFHSLLLFCWPCETAVPVSTFTRFSMCILRYGWESKVVTCTLCQSFSAAVSKQQESATHIYNVGFPVELLKEQWFHTDITREIAEERLKCHANGCFLVRESETERNCFSLSLKHPKGIAHYPIERKDSGHYEVSGTHKSFETLPKLVDHFTQNPLSKDVYHQLHSPCPKPSYNCEYKWKLDAWLALVWALLVPSHTA